MLTWTNLEVRTDDTLALGELKILPHEEVKKGSGFGLRATGAMVTAF